MVAFHVCAPPLENHRQGPAYTYSSFSSLKPDEPIITHGYTPTSRIRFRDVVQVIRVSMQPSALKRKSSTPDEIVRVVDMIVLLFFRNMRSKRLNILLFYPWKIIVVNSNRWVLRHGMVRNSRAQCTKVWHSIAKHNTAQCSTGKHKTADYSTNLARTVRHSTT